MPKFVLSIVSLLITETTTYLNKLYVEKNIPENNLKSCVTAEIFNQFNKRYADKMETNFNSVKIKNHNKIKNLISKQKSPNDQNLTTQWVENLSDVQIPDYALEILSLGPNYAIEINEKKSLPASDMISGISHLNSETKDQIRTKTCNMLTNHKN